MKKMILSALVIVLTFMTVMVMINLKTDYSYESMSIMEDTPQSQGSPDGTGLIFDDYDKDINIPVNNQKSIPDKTEGITKEQKGDKVNYNNYKDNKRLYEEYIAFNLPVPEGEPRESSFEALKTSNKYNKRENRIETLEKDIELSDMVYIGKIALNLDLKEINEIRKIISDGANTMEKRRIWNRLRYKLTGEEYDKLIEIAAKYE